MEKELRNGQGKKSVSAADLMGPQSDNIIQNVSINRQMFQSYLSWFDNNHVVTKDKFDVIVNGPAEKKEENEVDDEINEQDQQI